MSSVKNRQIIDAHCHVQFPQYDSDRDAVIRRAIERGISMVCVGTDLANSRQAVELAERYEGLYASVGVHPNEKNFNQDQCLMLAEHPKVVAIGEIGLDYYRVTNPEDRQSQKKRFVQQLEYALQVRKPIIVHCRDAATPHTGAHDDMLAILKSATGLSGVIHSFTGTFEQADAYCELGYFIGLNAIVTFSDQYAGLVQRVPLCRMLLETDAPYLAPEPHRGKRNEPLYIEGIGNKIAEIRGIKPEMLFDATRENTERLFNIRV